jgi:hypothetical protein
MLSGVGLLFLMELLCGMIVTLLFVNGVIVVVVDVDDNVFVINGFANERCLRIVLEDAVS